MKNIKIITRGIIKEFKFFLFRVLNIIPFNIRVKFSLTHRPSYSYCIYHAALLGKKLGLNSISVIEFGVATGNGLRFIENISKKVEKLVGIKIEIYGFDNGEGLPEPIDYRDLPYHWEGGYFRMDIPKLKSLLKNSTLVLGNIKVTSQSFFKNYSPAPVGAVFHDFDFYSSTKDSLELFKANNEYFLPRVFNYFDDTIGSEIELFNNFTGERLAINEFNYENKDIKFSPAYHLITKPFILKWYHQIWITHFFKHPKYNQFISEKNQQILIQKRY